jgi:ATP-binding cassette, subfamily B, bacterial
MQNVAKIFRQLRRCFTLVWTVSPKLVVIEITLSLLSGLLPVATLWLLKIIVDEITLLVRRGSADGSSLVLPVALAIFFTLSTLILGSITNFVRSLLRMKLNYHIIGLITQKALELDITFFESPKFYDKLEQARREANYRPYQLIQALFNIFGSGVSVIGMLGLLLALNPVLTIVLFVLAIPVFFIQSRFSRKNYELDKELTQGSREMYYFQYVLSDNHSAKEIRLFNLGNYLWQLYKAIFEKQYRQRLALSRKSLLGELAATMLGLIGYGLLMVYVVGETLAQRISLGDLAAYVAALSQAQTRLFGMMFSFNQLYENSLYLDNLFDFLALQPAMSPVPDSEAATVSRPLRQGFKLENVSFSYPQTEKEVLRNINLEIAPGETIALVGENGAGKTTLVKLLCRLYDPTSGSVQLDGHELNEYDLTDLQQNIGVIFQDYVRYWLSARENIGFGNVARVGELATIQTAAGKTGADRVVEKLADGYDTKLGAFWDKSDQLSGGEWQRIALARAFMRDAAVLILDEPTAALDARVEYETFQRFRELAAGKITILISHRFNSVRMADRIVVLENGEIVEIGTHTDLMALGGRYATLFNMQAAGYQ